jgi:hypothetical protein
MKVQGANMIRALFLLAVFSLNTIVGFACSIGIDMGYNSSHHQHCPSYSSEKKHSHKSGHKHSQGAGHNHSDEHKHTKANGTANNTQDDCCADDVTKFIQLDKSVVKTNLNLPVPTFMVAFTSIFIGPSLNGNHLLNSFGLLPVRRSCSIYDTDIRIAIQSFQI